jgi:hypothetical protein
MLLCTLLEGAIPGFLPASSIVELGPAFTPAGIGSFGLPPVTYLF